MPPERREENVSRESRSAPRSKAAVWPWRRCRRERFSGRQPDLKDLFGEIPARIEGLTYTPEFLGAEEERALLEGIGGLELREAAYKQYRAKRRIASFGSEYDFAHQALKPGPPLPRFLLPLRERLAGHLGLASAAFPHALVTEYSAGTPLGWHRDTPEFGLIAGVSLRSACRMRFRPYPAQRGRDPRAFDLQLEPRSLYVMQGAARWAWQHSVPPTPELRYSVTFRTLR